MRRPMILLLASPWLAAATGLVPVATAAGVDVEVQSSVIRHAHFHRREKSYDAMRAGGSLGAIGYGIWGYAEQLRSDVDTTAHYGELSGIVSVGDLWSLSGGGGSGSDYLYKPTSLALGDVMRRLPALEATAYAGYTHTVYAGDDPDIYQAARVGWQQKLKGGWSGHGFVHWLENHTESGEHHRLGTALGAALAHERGLARTAFGLQSSCLARTMGCSGGPREIYAETYVEGRWPLGDSYGLTGRLAYIGETGEKTERLVPYYFGSVWIGAGLFSRF